MGWVSVIETFAEGSVIFCLPDDGFAVSGQSDQPRLTLALSHVHPGSRPLYAKFRIPGICPIEPEPEEPTPEKSEGGLTSEFDRLFHSWPKTRCQPSHTCKFYRKQRSRKRSRCTQIWAPIRRVLGSNPTPNIESEYLVRKAQRRTDLHSHCDDQVTPISP